MAANTVTKTVLGKYGAATTIPSFVTAARTDGAVVAFDKEDHKILLMLKNAITNATHTAVIKAGNGLQGVSDLEITIQPADPPVPVCVVVESGRYKNVAGDNKGKVVILSKEQTTGTQIQVAAVVLP